MSGERDLERRQREILATIIRQYVSRGVPVGSKAIVEQLPESLSSATIRSVMAELEEAGYLAQPHVSAGRVPTDKAYRFYVDRITGTTPLAADLENYILVSLDARPERRHGEGEADETAGKAEPPDLLMQQLLTKVSRVLAEVSHNVGLVLGPAPEEKILEHVKFVKLPERRILTVIVSKPDLVENNVVRPSEEFSQEELDRAAEYLNGEFRGWSLAAIRMEIFKRLEEMKVACDHLVSSIASLFASGALASEETGTLFVGGTAGILDQPEFEDVGRMRDLLATFEEKAKLVRILSSCLHTPGRGVHILIGRENLASEMQECTLIVAPFHYRRQLVGALGIVGPTRMEYDRAITAVDYIAHLCSRLLSSN
jgi:heat-inducible transcriptional repressor